MTQVAYLHRRFKTVQGKEDPDQFVVKLDLQCVITCNKVEPEIRSWQKGPGPGNNK